jgi:hypothetical protein
MLPGQAYPTDLANSASCPLTLALFEQVHVLCSSPNHTIACSNRICSRRVYTKTCTAVQEASRSKSLSACRIAEFVLTQGAAIRQSSVLRIVTPARRACR